MTVGIPLLLGLKDTTNSNVYNSSNNGTNLNDGLMKRIRKLHKVLNGCHENVLRIQNSFILQVVRMLLQLPVKMMSKATRLMRL